MSKKDFRQIANPALQFISNQPDEAEPKTAPESVPERPAAAPDGYKANPLYIETRSRRAQIMLQPSIYSRAKAAADQQGISFNEFVNNAIENELNRR